jgi:hypothetical protein
MCTPPLTPTTSVLGAAGPQNPPWVMALSALNRHQHPLTSQALQQGGMFIFEGDACLFSHLDKATSDHADLQEVLGTALAGFGQDDCGCPPPPGSA